MCYSLRLFLLQRLSELVYESNAVVQQYVKNPLLIGGYKFDLRLYVCVPSFHPLTIYVYREGLARFGTDKFSLANLDNPFAHLTNCSLNKLGPGYGTTKEKVGSGMLECSSIELMKNTEFIGKIIKTTKKKRCRKGISRL